MPRKSRNKDKEPTESTVDTERLVSKGFAEAQRSLATHARVVKSLTRAYESDHRGFTTAFFLCWNRALVVFAREPAVERVVTFVATFAVANADSFSAPLLEYLFKHSLASSKGVRFRCVQSIAAIITALPDNYNLPDPVFVDLRDCALSRSRDRLPRVRAAAAGALCRLQSSGIPQEDDITARLVEMLLCDSSAAVRKSALNAVAITEGTLAAVQSRIRDVKDDVRKTAFQILATKVDPLWLEVTERLELLKGGLRDRSSTVRDSCTNDLLLGGWLGTACEGNVFTLVELLGGYTEEDLVLQALAAVLKSKNHQHLLEDIEIDINNLSLSDALVLRAMSQIKHADVALDKYIPSALAYAEVLKYYAVDSFASCHLLALGRGLDLSDEAGRRALETTLRYDFLKSRRVAHETVGPAIEALRIVSFNAESTVLTLTQLVRDEILRGDSENVLESIPDSQVEELSAEELEAWRERRTLLICKETLLKCRPSSSDLVAPNSAYMELVQLTAVRQVLSQVNENRATAVECLGLFCLLDKSGFEARAKIKLFMQASKDELSVAVVALKVIIDCMMVFELNDSVDVEGERRRSAPSEDSTITEECLQLISEYMTHTEAEMRTLAVEGMAKLLFTRRVDATSGILSRMLIAFHNPSTEDDARMQQCLSVFFNAFAMLNASNRQILEQAYLPTMTVFHDAPSTSPLSNVDSIKVGQFILHLTALGESDEMVTLEMHARIAESMLNAVLDIGDVDAKVGEMRAYAKLLSGMRFQEELELNAVLLKLTDAALDFFEDKKTISSLRRFKDKISLPVNHVSKKGRMS